MNSRCCPDKAACGRNNEDAWSSARGPRKCGCVGKFSPKIEAAQESEHLRDCRACLASQFSSHLELCPIAQNHFRSLTSGVSGGEKKDSVVGLLFHAVQFS